MDTGAIHTTLTASQEVNNHLVNEESSSQVVQRAHRPGFIEEECVGKSLLLLSHQVPECSKRRLVGQPGRSKYESDDTHTLLREVDEIGPFGWNCRIRLNNSCTIGLKILVFR